MDNLKWVLKSAEKWRMKKTEDWWLASVLYLIGSWSSLFSLLWMIFIPLFLARGHPERLEINDSVAKLKHTAWVCVRVRVCDREWEKVQREGRTVRCELLRSMRDRMYIVPSVWGVVASDMSRTIAPWCRAPGAEDTKKGSGPTAIEHWLDEVPSSCLINVKVQSGNNPGRKQDRFQQLF